MYLCNRALTKVPDGCTSCKVLYDMTLEHCKLVYIWRTVCHHWIEQEFEVDGLWVKL